MLYSAFSDVYKEIFTVIRTLWKVLCYIFVRRTRKEKIRIRQYNLFISLYNILTTYSLYYTQTVVSMITFHFILCISILIGVNTLSNNKLLSVSSRQTNVSTNKIKADMHRIRQILKPLRPLYNSRDVYQKYNNLLQTLWICCPEQRTDMFDIRDVYRAVAGRTICHYFIKENRTRLTTACQKNLKLYDSTNGGIGICDGRLLRNLVDQYIFVVQLSDYTEKWCTGGLYSMLIYSDINRVLPCERAIRRGLRNDPEVYAKYDTLSSQILDRYVQNINNYRDCNNLHFWDREAGDEEVDPSLPTIEYRK